MKMEWEEMRKRIGRKLDRADRCAKAATSAGDRQNALHWSIRYIHLYRVMEVLQHSMRYFVMQDADEEAIAQSLLSSDDSEERLLGIQYGLCNRHRYAAMRADQMLEEARRNLAEMTAGYQAELLEKAGIDTGVQPYTHRPEPGAILLRTGCWDDVICAYLWLCAFDFCTVQMGRYVGVTDYRNLPTYHEHLAKDGTLLALQTMVTTTGGADKAQTLTLPEPSPKALKTTYARNVAALGGLDKAMLEFPALVAKMAMDLYRNKKDLSA